MVKLNNLFVIFILFAVSCTSKDNIIPKKDMVSILVKIHIVDASVRGAGVSDEYVFKDTVDLYSKSIESFGYTKVQFDSSLAYYAKKPKVLDGIYDKVINELSALETNIIAENEIKTDSLAIRDSVENLWNLKQKWNFSADSNTTSIDFSIPVKGLGTYTVSADICVFPDDESNELFAEAYFFIDDKTPVINRLRSESTPFIKDGKVHNYLISLEQKNSLVTQLRGSIIKQRNGKKNFKKHATVTNIRVEYKPSIKKLNRLKKKQQEKQVLQ